MTEERFLQLFNDLDKVLRKVCGIADEKHEAVGSMLTKAKDLSRHNPVAANWDKLYVARQLRNLMVHEKRTGLAEVAQPSQELIVTLENVIAQYQKPKTIQNFVVESDFAKPVWFDTNATLIDILRVIKDKKYSQFPIFDDGKYVGMVSENAITNWLAKSLTDERLITGCRDVSAKDILKEEESGREPFMIYKESTLYDVIDVFESKQATVVLVCEQSGSDLVSSNKLIAVLTVYDLPAIYKAVQLANTE
ncbi:TPA: CBS domain-containing protein [Streptococcus suis]|nr:CBS domain-containing protein [Streptococcus suis]